MKRAFLAAAVVIVALAAARPAPAADRKIGFLFNLGFMTRDDLSPQWITLGPELALPVGTWLTVSPEVTLWGSNLGFRNYYVVPGALINFRVGRFTIGAGAIRRFWVSRFDDGRPAEKIALKIQLGYRSGRSRIALIAVPLPTHDYVSLGLALGMGF